MKVRTELKAGQETAIAAAVAAAVNVAKIRQSISVSGANAGSLTNAAVISQTAIAANSGSAAAAT
jgi:hypothetical protein